MKFFLATAVPGLLGLALMSSCEQAQPVDKSALASNFYQHYNARDFGAMEAYLSDDIALISDGDTVVSGKAAFNGILEYGKVLNYLVEHETPEDIEGRGLTVWTSNTNARTDFLYGQPIITEDVFHFDGDKICAIDVQRPDGPDGTTEEGEAKWAAFRQWVHDQHPDQELAMLEVTAAGASVFLKMKAAYEEALAAANQGPRKPMTSAAPKHSSSLLLAHQAVRAKIWFERGTQLCGLESVISKDSLERLSVAYQNAMANWRKNENALAALKLVYAGASNRRIDANMLYAYAPGRATELPACYVLTPKEYYGNLILSFTDPEGKELGCFDKERAAGLEF